MKSSRSTKVKPDKEEECGIWLDTKELKQKKQNRTRPIISRSSVSVLFSFTQTRLNMPVTRQSSISSFFTPKPTDPNRSETHTEMTHTGSKRKHHLTIDSSCHTPELHLQNWDADWERPKDTDGKEQRFLRLIRGEEDEPPEKRKPVAHHTEEYPNLTHTFLHGASREAPPSPKDADKHEARDQKLTVLVSRSVNEHRGRSSATPRRKTNASPGKRTGKENRCPASPIQNTPPSPFKRRLVSRLTERHTLPNASETLAGLFTQDSEGLCVIAHRDREGRSQSDAASVTEEEDEEMLFTQDSEGNMVIKH
ncbi:aurora kinase A- and ninein-interacting protein isoform X2 [Pseudorasbora parva]|uniref:aurora kinase A- and ninein-interacting protein isoform X2 n=1 Tax=Pseudorasbora parva TaxID=51549 RepID=UPI00351DD59C